MVPMLPGSGQEPARDKRSHWEPHFRRFFSVKLKWLQRGAKLKEDLDGGEGSDVAWGSVGVEDNSWITGETINSWEVD